MLDQLDPNLTLADALEEYRTFITEDELNRIEQHRWRVIIRYPHREWFQAHIPCRIYPSREAAAAIVDDLINTHEVAEAYVLDRWTHEVINRRKAEATPKQLELGGGI